MAKTLAEMFNEAQAKHITSAKTGNMELLKEALETYNECLNMAPNEPILIFSVGSALTQLGYNGAGINMLIRARDIDPTKAEVWNNLGSAYKAEFMHPEAEECWRKAAELKPYNADYQLNLSTLFINEGNPEGGMPYADKAIELDPASEKAHWNRSLLLLEMGRWREGFIGYDSGLLSLDRQYRIFDKEDKIPNWKGKDIKDKTIVVYGEQGLGDEIMFASCIPDLIATGAKVIYECHPRLYSLMKRSFPELEAVYPTRKSKSIDWPQNHSIDYKVAIGSLFRWFRSDGNFPRLPYLVPDPDLVKEYRQRLIEAGDSPHIGFGWAGGSKRTHGSARSLKLTPMLPVLSKDATFISLQYTPEADEKVKRFKSDHGIDIHHWADVVRADNYDHTVALIAALDLVIAINTTVVHVCGAIGKECWTVTPDRCAWRYAQGGNHMVMYGDWVTQFREDGDMNKAITDLSTALSYLPWDKKAAS